MPAIAYLVLTAGWICWFLPFPLNGWNTERPEKRDDQARWGLAFQVAAYLVLLSTGFSMPLPDVWRVVFSVIFFALASILSWSSVRALGRHLRFDAVLVPQHQLVRTGPYRILRHPIYTSMLSLFLATGLILSPLRILLLAALLFIVGTEIRIRSEDKLLAARFGDQFQEYKRTVSSYVPLLR